MHVTRSALRDDADLAAAGAAELGRVWAADDLDLFDGIDARILLDRDVGPAIHVIGPIHGPVILALPRTIDRHADNVVAAARIGRAEVNLIGEIG